MKKVYLMKNMLLTMVLLAGMITESKGMTVRDETMHSQQEAHYHLLSSLQQPYNSSLGKAFIVASLGGISSYICQQLLEYDTQMRSPYGDKKKRGRASSPASSLWEKMQQTLSRFQLWGKSTLHKKLTRHGKNRYLTPLMRGLLRTTQVIAGGIAVGSGVQMYFHLCKKNPSEGVSEEGKQREAYPTPIKQIVNKITSAQRKIKNIIGVQAPFLADSPANEEEMGNLEKMNMMSEVLMEKGMSEEHADKITNFSFKVVRLNTNQGIWSQFRSLKRVIGEEALDDFINQIENLNSTVTQPDGISAETNLALCWKKIKSYSLEEQQGNCPADFLRDTEVNFGTFRDEIGKWEKSLVTSPTTDAYIQFKMRYEALKAAQKLGIEVDKVLSLGETQFCDDNEHAESDSDRSEGSSDTSSSTDTDTEDNATATASDDHLHSATAEDDDSDSTAPSEPGFHGSATAGEEERTQDNDSQPGVSDAQESAHEEGEQSDGSTPVRPQKKLQFSSQKVYEALQRNLYQAGAEKIAQIEALRKKSVICKVTQTLGLNWLEDVYLSYVTKPELQS